jgi:protein phosphatase 1 regulatory subunit 12A
MTLLMLNVNLSLVVIVAPPQACIDDNLDMVEFLVASGADVDRGDNEGWTPLHATASCGFLSIAHFLLEHGSNVAAVNNDGELAIDISESDEMEELLQKEINLQSVNCEEARNREEQCMLDDARDWKNSGKVGDKPHHKTGATALHVAAAKGYVKVISLLLQAGCDVNQQVRNFTVQCWMLMLLLSSRHITANIWFC